MVFLLKTLVFSLTETKLSVQGVNRCREHGVHDVAKRFAISFFDEINDFNNTVFDGARRDEQRTGEKVLLRVGCQVHDFVVKFGA